MWPTTICRFQHHREIPKTAEMFCWNRCISSKLNSGFVFVGILFNWPSLMCLNCDFFMKSLHELWTRIDASTHPLFYVTKSNFVWIHTVKCDWPFWGFFLSHIWKWVFILMTPNKTVCRQSDDSLSLNSRSKRTKSFGAFTTKWLSYVLKDIIKKAAEDCLFRNEG